jgi:hypothetical protein
MSDDTVDSLIRQLERLRLQEALVLQNLIAARQRENSGNNSPETETFRIGNRITVNNPKPRFGRALSTNDSRAIITKVTETRIYYKTLNGTATWRSRANLTRVDTEVNWAENE